ncbi:GfV-B13-ORF1 [Ichnoviriform fumiferanae]|uniref:GfV-B13-ORF1 n=1 Tax=Ichnoviriform fumiferanae TaxID=419435 RepID=A2PZR1_9VIRU|nr:GfV-B13-ORF1 [Ichnoviriform fumiferanae]BAF45483.1 GfV-B13-ORF1 [Ichnoviriform fumiferanae]
MMGLFGEFTTSHRWSKRSSNSQYRLSSLKPYDNLACYLNGYMTKEKFIVTSIQKFQKMDYFIDMMLLQNTKVVVIPGPSQSKELANQSYFWNNPAQYPESDARYKMITLNHTRRDSYSIFDVYIESTQFKKTLFSIKVFQFRNWIDERIPANINQFGAFIEEANIANRNNMHNSETFHPIIVHFDHHNNVGMFCALDICLEYFAHKGEVDVNNVIHRVCQGPYTKNIIESQCNFIIAVLDRAASIVKPQ